MYGGGTSGGMEGKFATGCVNQMIIRDFKDWCGLSSVPLPSQQRRVYRFDGQVKTFLNRV